jgi:hypothetical protein
MNEEKRMVSDTGYEVKRQFHIGGTEILLAENLKAEDGNFYLVCGYRENGIIGEYSRAETTDDYLEAVSEFTGRVNEVAEKIRAERDAQNIPGELFTSEHCYPNDYSESIEGKVVAINASVLSPEYRHGSNQLVLAVHGNGARANSRGNAVYCYHLNNGEHTRFERYDVLGVVRELPDWAKERLARVLAEREAEKTPTREVNAGYTITERAQVGDMQFVLGERPDGKYVTWQRYKGHSGFEHGHYFDNREKAVSDLHARADRERDISDNNPRHSRNRDDAR